MEITEGLEGFVEIVGHGSLTAAADAMGLPRSTLSRQLSRLEDRMGVQLLHRTTRKIVLTRAGEDLFAHARRIVDDTRAAVDAVRRHDDVPRGTLRVTAPPAHDPLLGEPILSFIERYPAVSLELDATPRVVDLVAEGFDVALRGGASSPPDHVRRVLMRSDAIAVAAPAYLAQHGRPASPADLAAHTLILGFDHGHVPEKAWPLLDGGTVRVGGRIATNDLLLRRAMAIGGKGIAMLPTPAARLALQAGSLEHVLAGQIGVAASLAIVYPRRDFVAPKVRAFVDHMVQWAESLPAGHPCALAASRA